LDAICKYVPNDTSEAESILERIIPCLGNNNSGVVLSCIKLAMKYLDFMDSPDMIRNYTRKMSAPLITLLGTEHEI